MGQTYTFNAHILEQRMNSDWSVTTLSYVDTPITIDVPSGQTTFTIEGWGGVSPDDLSGATVTYGDSTADIGFASPVSIYRVTHSGGLVTDVMMIDVHLYTDGGETASIYGFDSMYIPLSGDPLPSFADGEDLNEWVAESTGWWEPATAGEYQPGSVIYWEAIDVDDPILGTDGADRMVGTNWQDTIYGMDGADTIIGHGGDDFIFGGDSENDLRDVIYGGDGDDSIDGGYGNDELRGDAGADSIEGGYGVDIVIGGAGNDVLTGSAWSDQIFGGADDDFINGGYGFDRVNGGDGADKFYHTGNAGHGSDWIQDYTAADGDVLFYGAAATADDFLVQRASTPNAGDAAVQEVFITHIPSGVLLWALVDGDAQAELNVLSAGQTFDLLA